MQSESSKVLGAQLKKFNNLNIALSSLSGVYGSVIECMQLDEVTDVALKACAGLADSAVSPIDLTINFDEPATTNKHIVAQTMTVNIEQVYNELLDIRTRALVRLIQRHRTHVNELAAQLDKYVQTVFPAVTRTLGFGRAGDYLSATRPVSDEDIWHVVRCGFADFDPDAGTNETVPTATAAILNNATMFLDNVNMMKFNEWVEGTIERLPQGDGFSPVSKPFTENDTRIEYRGFFDNRIYSNLMIGSIVSGGPYSKTRDCAITDTVNAEAANFIMESFTAFSKKVQDYVNNSPIIMRDYEQLDQAFFKVERLPIELFNVYFGDNRGDDELPISLNRTADFVLGQLLAVSSCLENVITALPIIMNYCIKDKL